MIVAVRSVRMMEVAPNQIVGVRHVWDRVVPAAHCVLVAGLVTTASVRCGAAVGIGA